MTIMNKIFCLGSEALLPGILACIMPAADTKTYGPNLGTSDTRPYRMLAFPTFVISCRPIGIGATHDYLELNGLPDARRPEVIDLSTLNNTSGAIYE